MATNCKKESFNKCDLLAKLPAIAEKPQRHVGRGIQYVDNNNVDLYKLIRINVMIVKYYGQLTDIESVYERKLCNKLPYTIHNIRLEESQR